MESTINEPKQRVIALDGAEGYDGINIYEAIDKGDGTFQWDELVDQVPYGDDPLTAMRQVAKEYDVADSDIPACLKK